MSGFSQFLQLPRTPPTSLRVQVLNAVCQGCGNSTYGQGVVRALWSGSGTHAGWAHLPPVQGCSGHICRFYTCQTVHLLATLLWSCENRFFTLFWRREPQKGTARWQPAGSCSVKGRKSRHDSRCKTWVEGSLWAKRWSCRGQSASAGPDQETSL